MIIDPVQVHPEERPGAAGAQDRPAVWAGIRRGFTLVEATIAMVLLGIAAAGVLLPFSHGAAVQAEGRRLMLAARLADELMEGVLATPFDQIVARGDGYTTTEAAGQIADAQGTPLTDPIYANFSRDLSYYYLYPNLAEWKPTPDFVLAQVQVYYQGRKLAALSRLISR